MQEFDYIQAWHYVAVPAYYSLPEDARKLFRWAMKVVESEELGQLSDLTMKWPADPSFRELFEALPSDVLAFAARTAYYFGHWKPSAQDIDPALEIAEEDVDALKVGAWKFSHYCDQVLRKRLGMPESGGSTHRGVGYEVHQGALRVTFSSRDLWAWHEVAPATEAGLGFARNVGRLLDLVTNDSIAYNEIEQARKNLDGWPEEWLPFATATEKYMVEKGQMGIPSIRDRNRTIAIQRKLEALPGEVENKIQRFAENQRTELAGRLWWLERGIDDENLIYYNHTGVFCFGWREKVSSEFASRLLDLASEFPFEYEIRAADKTYSSKAAKAETETR